MGSVPMFVCMYVVHGFTEVQQQDLSLGYVEQ